jgi:TRAP-type mannitol/chloroaromatic compound transport system substrate-binding protein
MGDRANRAGEKIPGDGSRRGFLRKAAIAAGAAGAATMGFPMVSRAQTTVLKMQGSWGAQDILNEWAQNYVAKVNDLGGGRLRVDYLNAGAVVKPFSVQDGVHAGVLDGAHTVPVYWYSKHRAASLFGTGPSYGFNASQTLGWFYYGGGQELYTELVQKILGLNIVGFFTFPMPTQPLGWFKREIKAASDFKGMKYRTVGLAANLFQEMGASVAQLPGGEILPAMEKGVIDAFEFNNPSSDSRFGAQDVAKWYYLGSYHQTTECFELMWNKKKFDSLAKEQQAILRYAAQAASADCEWKAWDQYSRDLQELIEKHKVNVRRTPASVFEAQLAAWDRVAASIMKDPRQGAFIKKVLDSQRAWARRVGFYYFTNEADFKAAYEHYFGPIKA